MLQEPCSMIYKNSSEELTAFADADRASDLNGLMTGGLLLDFGSTWGRIRCHGGWSSQTGYCLKEQYTSRILGISTVTCDVIWLQYFLYELKVCQQKDSIHLG